MLVVVVVRGRGTVCKDSSSSGGGTGGGGGGYDSRGGVEIVEKAVVVMVW